MSKVKTSPNEQNVEQFLNDVEDEQKRQDAFTLLEMMQRLTGESPKMWGGSIVGFGSYHYRYESGREGDWFVSGFSPRKQNLTLYIMSGFSGHDELMARLGKHSVGKSCLYVKKLAAIDLKVLEELIQRSVQYIREKYPSS